MQKILIIVLCLITLSLLVFTINQQKALKAELKNANSQLEFFYSRMEIIMGVDNEKQAMMVAWGDGPNRNTVRWLPFKSLDQYVGGLLIKPAPLE